MVVFPFVPHTITISFFTCFERWERSVGEIFIAILPGIDEPFFPASFPIKTSNLQAVIATVFNKLLRFCIKHFGVGQNIFVG